MRSHCKDPYQYYKSNLISFYYTIKIVWNYNILGVHDSSLGDLQLLRRNLVALVWDGVVVRGVVGVETGPKCSTSAKTFPVSSTVGSPTSS